MRYFHHTTEYKMNFTNLKNGGRHREIFETKFTSVRPNLKISFHFFIMLHLYSDTTTNNTSACIKHDNSQIRNEELIRNLSQR